MDGSNENRTRIRLLARSPKASEALTLDDLVVLTTYDLGETRRTMYRAELVILFDRVDAARTVIDERWGHPARSGIPDDVREHRSKVSGIRTILREALCLRSLCVKRHHDCILSALMSRACYIDECARLRATHKGLPRLPMYYTTDFLITPTNKGRTVELRERPLWFERVRGYGEESVLEHWHHSQRHACDADSLKSLPTSRTYVAP